MFYVFALSRTCEREPFTICETVTLYTFEGKRYIRRLSPFFQANHHPAELLPTLNLQMTHFHSLTLTNSSVSVSWSTFCSPRGTIYRQQMSNLLRIYSRRYQVNEFQDFPRNLQSLKTTPKVHTSQSRCLAGWLRSRLMGLPSSSSSSMRPLTLARSFSLFFLNKNTPQAILLFGCQVTQRVSFVICVVYGLNRHDTRQTAITLYTNRR